MARELVLELDENVTVGAVMNALAAARPDLFPARSCADGTRPGMVCLFAGAEQLKNPKVRLRDTLRPGLQLSVALVRPIAGG